MTYAVTSIIGWVKGQIITLYCLWNIFHQVIAMDTRALEELLRHRQIGLLNMNFPSFSIHLSPVYLFI